jgi:ribosomal protein L32
MPCYRCGVRQSDPEQGKPSPWKRGVRREHQVLICPDCAGDAVAELDRCSRCGSTHLIRRLDQVECLACGLARDVNLEPEPGRSAPAPGSLADEVARALDRVLGREQSRG